MSTGLERLTTALGDRYRIEREIGQGGMATVYLAEDLRHDRKVALKVLAPELAAVIGAERFLAEIKTTANLQHPHILPLFDSGRVEGTVYYAMPFVEGESLRERLERENQLPVADAVRIAREVAGALDYAHRRGVIHRDVKPENVLLHDGRALVADFGIALAASRSEGSARMTETGMSLGTPRYMSPEQAMGEKGLDARTDVYALGCVLYEMLAGEPPFTGPTAQAIVAKVMSSEPEPVTTLRRMVPVHVVRAVHTAIQKLPADRFASAAKFAEALSDASFVVTAIATSEGSVIESRWKRRALLAAALAALLSIPAIRSAFARGPGEDAAEAWQFRITLPDSTPMNWQMSLSADGSLLVYDGGDRLWIRSASNPDPTPIAGSEGADFPAISRDGRRVAFLRESGEVEVMPIQGGAARIVATNADLGTSIDWTSNAHILYATSSGLMEVPVDGGTPRRLTTVDTAAGEVLHVDASALPDGNGALFQIVQQSGGSVVAAVGGDGGEVSRLMDGTQAIYAHPGHLIVTRLDGTIVAVPFDAKRRRLTGPPMPIASGLSTGGFTSIGRTAASANGRLVYVAGGWGYGLDPGELVWVGRDGESTPASPGWNRLFLSLALSPDGRRVAISTYVDQGEVLEVRDLTNGSVVRVAIGLTQLRFPAFSPDASKLYFAGFGARMGLHRVEADGSGEPERIELPAPYVLAPVIAPGNEAVYYSTAHAGGSLGIARNSLTSGGDAVPLTPSGITTIRPELSPDGRWLAFITTAGSQAEVHVRSTDPARSEDWLVSQAVSADSDLRWSRAGDELFFSADDSMMSARVNPSTAFAVSTPRALFSAVGLDPKFALGPDGRFLMIRARPDLREPTVLMMLERWTDLLPRAPRE